MSSHSISESLYEAVAQDAHFQGGYCRAPQEVLPYRLEIEHILPRSMGGGNERANLWLSCHKCNQIRSNRMELTDPLSGAKVSIFNPRKDEWSHHFTWELNGLLIVGLTAVGRAIVENLRLNDSFHQAARSAWISAKRYPPSET